MAIDPVAILRELEARSQRHAHGLPEQKEQPTTWDGVAFRLAGQLFVAALSQVREILPVPATTRVPNARSWLLGVANVRGRLITVVDLAEFLAGRKSEGGRGARILIAENKGITAAFWVAEVLGMRHFASEELRTERPALEPWVNPYVAGYYDRQGQKWPVFDLHAVLENGEFMRVAA